MKDGNSSETGFKDWFEALDFMKNQMDQSDYEIAYTVRLHRRSFAGVGSGNECDF